VLLTAHATLIEKIETALAESDLRAPVVRRALGTGKGEAGRSRMHELRAASCSRGALTRSPTAENATLMSARTRGTTPRLRLRHHPRGARHGRRMWPVF